jgi:hypothetical protein
MADTVPPYPIDVDPNSFERIDWFNRTTYAINNPPTVVGSNVSYWMVANVGAIKKPVVGAYVPPAVVFSGYSATGTNPPVAYAGRFIIATTTDGTTFTTQYTSASNESSKSYTVPASIVGIRVQFYFAGGTTNLIDETFVPVVADGTDGAGSNKYATAAAFQWSNAGCPAHSQAFTFTWSGFTASAYPAGWTSTAPASPGSGYTLWTILLPLTDVQSAVTTAANWNVATENVFGYRQDGSIGATGSTGATGATGSTGATGATGNNGNSSRMMYAKAASSTTFTPGSTDTTSGGTTFPDVTSHFGISGLTWQQTPPAIAANESLFQSDGIFTPSPGANTTVWQTPYLSNLKVGSLSAIVANLGFVNIAAGGALSSGKTSTTDYSTPGFYIGNDGGTPKILFGSDATHFIEYNGSSLNIKGGDLLVGNPALGTSTIVSGAGVGITPSGSLFAGNTTNSIVWNASTGILTLNGTLVQTSNMAANAISTAPSALAVGITPTVISNQNIAATATDYFTGTVATTNQTILVTFSGRANANLRTSGVTSSNQVMVLSVSVDVVINGVTTRSIGDFFLESRYYVENSDQNKIPVNISGALLVPAFETVTGIRVTFGVCEFRISRFNGYSLLSCLNTCSLTGIVGYTLFKV